MVLIPLSGKVAAGRSAMVDDNMATELMKYRWYCNSKGYAGRSVNYRTSGGRRTMRTIYMHGDVWRLAGRTIPESQELDHINGSPLDNCLENLRLATCGQNQHNRKPQKGSTSRYKGVSWIKERGKRRAQITHNGKTIHLGLFTDEIDAAKAYDVAARRLFGEYARCNFTP